MSSERIIIIGSGPAGLGAAYRLKELGYENWAMYEQDDRIGGLSSSFVDEQGFTWDIGGHVMFSSIERFNRLADGLMGQDFISHERESWIRTLKRWVPYPFQNNIRYLPKDKIVECLLGLISAQYSDKKTSANFEDWIYKTFGEGIANLFLGPYNAKVWAVPLNLMSYDWIAERISPISIERIMRNVVMEQDDIGWGPNNRFKFPLYGGTGGFFNEFMPEVKEKIHFRKKLTSIDIDAKKVALNGSEADDYDSLINTAPIDLVTGMIKSGHTDTSSSVRAASQLKHNGIYVVGLGLRKKMIGTKCWAYFPDEEVPFYRLTYFSHYSPNNVPNGDTDTYSSLMCEISFSEYKPADESRLVDLTIESLIREGVIAQDDSRLIVSKWVKKIEYAYPIPTLQRDDNLRLIQSFLLDNNIYSRGRFGAWLYELGNMDHSTLMGIEAVDRIVLGEKETLWKA
ncbi:MAG: FAD-dependent oxidoreductase [Nitrospirae bacterium]|nr:FAD-dependent oxidoreductase [Nitrospirota bacterium]